MTIEKGKDSCLRLVRQYVASDKVSGLVLTFMHTCYNLQVFKTEELQMISDLCIKHNLLCISDEVYEWLTYDGAEHVKIGEEECKEACQNECRDHKSLIVNLIQTIVTQIQNMCTENSVSSSSIYLALSYT